MLRIIIYDINKLNMHLKSTLTFINETIDVNYSINYIYYKKFRFRGSQYINIPDSYFYLLLNKEYSIPVYKSILNELNSYEKKNILFYSFWLIITNLNKSKNNTMLNIHYFLEKIMYDFVYNPTKISFKSYLTFKTIHVEELDLQWIHYFIEFFPGNSLQQVRKKKLYSYINKKTFFPAIETLYKNVLKININKQYIYWKTNTLKAFRYKYQLVKKKNHSFFKIVNLYDYLNSVRNQSFFSSIAQYKWITLNWFAKKYKEYLSSQNTNSDTFIHESFRLSKLERHNYSCSQEHNNVAAFFTYLNIIKNFEDYSEYMTLDVPSKYIKDNQSILYSDYFKSSKSKNNNYTNNRTITTWSSSVTHFIENINNYKQCLLKKWLEKKKSSSDITHINDLVSCFFIEKKNNLYMIKILQDNIFVLCNTFFYRRYNKNIKYNYNTSVKWKSNKKLSIQKSPLISDLFCKSSTLSNKFYTNYLIASQKAIIYKRPKVKKRKQKRQLIRKGDLERVFGSKKKRVSKKWVRNSKKLKTKSLKKVLNLRKQYLLNNKKVNGLDNYNNIVPIQYKESNLFRNTKNINSWKTKLFVNWLKLKKYTPWKKFYNFFRWKKKKMYIV